MSLLIFHCDLVWQPNAAKTDKATDFHSKSAAAAIAFPQGQKKINVSFIQPLHVPKHHYLGRREHFVVDSPKTDLELRLSRDRLGGPSPQAVRWLIVVLRVFAMMCFMAQSCAMDELLDVILPSELDAEVNL